MIHSGRENIRIGVENTEKVRKGVESKNRKRNKEKYYVAINLKFENGEN